MKRLLQLTIVLMVLGLTTCDLSQPEDGVTTIDEYMRSLQKIPQEATGTQAITEQTFDADPPEGFCCTIRKFQASAAFHEGICLDPSTDVILGTTITPSDAIYGPLDENREC